MTTCYKKVQLSCYSQLMTSRSSTFRFLAKHHHTRDTGTHKNLKLTEEVIATMMEHPSTTGGRLAAEARKRIARIDEESLTTHASSLAKERDLFAIKEKDAKLSSSIVAKLPENHFAFAMTPSLTIPTSADGENCHLISVPSAGGRANNL